jgi:hypothetical protein
MSLFTIAGGKIICRQCRAKSKRTLVQCQAPAMKGKDVCRFHGGLSTGPTTIEGRERCAQARTVHGNDTRKSRAELSEGLACIASLELIARSIGMITGPKPRGRRPKK